MFCLLLSLPFPPIRILQREAQSLLPLPLLTDIMSILSAHPWPLSCQETLSSCSMIMSLLQNFKLSESKTESSSSVYALQCLEDCKCWKFIMEWFKYFLLVILGWCSDAFTVQIGLYISSSGQLFEVGHIMYSHFIVEDMKIQKG